MFTFVSSATRLGNRISGTRHLFIKVYYTPATFFSDPDFIRKVYLKIITHAQLFKNNNNKLLADKSQLIELFAQQKATDTLILRVTELIQKARLAKVSLNYMVCLIIHDSDDKVFLSFTHTNELEHEPEKGIKRNIYISSTKLPFCIYTPL